ncbi:uncharacterized protein LOC113582815 [Electrophorus electricus]|uniref:Immunoglobulin domain-containing protein n=1 Tax=Electrophorus electricus TaxID=8005 RepID=A0A4W4HE68_ELEEL|nr:uncharacterized protein LOC113582815 [Electrophorus electricus]
MVHEGHSSTNMKIIWLFCLLLWCGAAESFTDKMVDLGQNVTLRCEVAVRDVYWYLMKPSHPPVFILRSFSSKITIPLYNSTTLNKQFSLQLNSSLFIQNITLKELGIYYCIQIDTPPRISNGIKLHSRLHKADNQNQTCECKQFQDETHDEDEEMRLWRNLLITSGLLICVLVIVVTGMTVSHCKVSPNHLLQPPNSRLQKHHALSAVQNQFPVLLQTEVQTNYKSNTFILVEFNQFNPGL